MVNVQVYGSSPVNEWLVRQFEAYGFSGEPVTENLFLVLIFPLFFILITGRSLSTIARFYWTGFFAHRLFQEPLFFSSDLYCNVQDPVFSRIFGLNMAPVPGKSIQLAEDIFAPIWEAMKALPALSDRAACFSEFCQSFAGSLYEPDAIDILYDKILAQSITRPLQDIMKECFASRRTLYRKFVQRTGGSPKTLARIIRLDYLWRKIRNEHATDYQELIFDCNYFDQAHFINDFKSILGETPGYFMNRKQNVLKMYSGMPFCQKK